MNERIRAVVYFAILVAVIVIVIGYLCWPLASTRVLIVRHADRDDAVDAISPIGVARSEELVHVAGRAGVDTIITSDTNRARQTAAPLAASLGLAPLEHPREDTAGLAARIRSDHRGETVFVVAHSDTLPAILSALGGPAVAIGHDEYDNLFTLTLCPCRGTDVVWLEYGAATP